MKKTSSETGSKVMFQKLGKKQRKRLDRGRKIRIDPNVTPVRSRAQPKEADIGNFFQLPPFSIS